MKEWRVKEAAKVIEQYSQKDSTIDKGNLFFACTEYQGAYLAKCQEVTDLEAKVKAYEAALTDIRKCQFNDIGSWLVDRAAKVLKEHAAGKGE